MIDYQLIGKIVIVIGGVLGIGLVVVQMLVVFGVCILVWDFKQDVVDVIVVQLCSIGVQVIGIVLDVIDDVVVEVVVQCMIKEFDGLYVVVNNVGISGLVVVSGDYFFDGWQCVIDVNFISVFLCQCVQIQVMCVVGMGGSIINMVLILGQVGYVGFIVYVVVKYGVVGLIQIVVWEYVVDGICVNVVGLGFISMLLLERMDLKVCVMLEGWYVLKWLGMLEEVVVLVVWLVSDDVLFVIGMYYVIDGGYFVQ